MIRTKEKIAHHILKQETYLPESVIYDTAFKGLLRLPLYILEDIELLMVIKVQESNELDRKVQKILAK